MSANRSHENNNWFMRLLSNVLQRYTRHINLEFFKRKYPGLPPQAIAERRIKAAANAAGLVGFVSGGVIAVASTATVLSALGTVASGLLASPVTVPTLAVSIPVGLLSFVGEVSLLVRLQIHLAYDLFVLYSLPLNLEDPEDLYQVVSVAFGIKSAELAGQALQKAIPQLAPSLLRQGMRAGLIRRRFQAWVARKLTWAFARKYLAEGVLIRFLVPGVSVATATAWDYVSTSSIGHRLQSRIMRRGLAAKRAEKMSLDGLDDPALVLRAAIGMAWIDGRFSETEATFYSTLAARVRRMYGDSVCEELDKASSLEWAEIWPDLADVTDIEQQSVMYHVLTDAAVIEGQLQRQKIKRLKQVSQLYHLPFDLKRLKEQASAFKEPQPLRTCLLGVLVLFVLLLASCMGCSLLGWFGMFNR